MGEAIRTFEDLDVWQSCRKMRKFVAVVAKQLPDNEKYRMVDQMLRSGRSVTANIAEGYGRFHHKENIQFCRQARGSLYETLDHFICAFDEEIISEGVLSDYRKLFCEALKLLNGYIKYLKGAAN